MKNNTFALRVFAAIFGLIFLEISSAQLTGSVRKNVIEGAQKSCFKTQREGSLNSSIGDAVLRQYCRCSAHYVADLLNEPLVRDIEAGRTKLNPIFNQMAAEYCRINYQKY
jgi:hypothetical protein